PGLAVRRAPLPIDGQLDPRVRPRVGNPMWAASVDTRRWIVALLGGSLALAAAARPAPPPPTEPTIIQHVANGTSPSLRATHCAIERRRDPVIEAMLISRPDAVAGCGHFLIETPMVFADHDLADDQRQFRVLVPCAEMSRPVYSHDAGDAPVLQVGKTYLLELQPVAGDVPWRAVRIDLAPRAAVADPVRPQPGGLPASPGHLDDR